MRKIVMLAHFGDMHQKPIDGGQTSSRKCLNVLLKHQIKVSYINRKSTQKYGFLFSKTYVLFWGTLTLIQYFFRLFFSSRKDTISLSICYCGSMMPFDFFSVIIPKLLGFKHVLYIKGGRTSYEYKKRGILYKSLFKKTISNASIIFTEGEDNIFFCKSLCSTKIIHIPNYTEDGFQPEVLPIKHEPLVFLYFGRLCEEKNVLLTIKIFENICKYYSNSKLRIIGRGTTLYIEEIKMNIRKSQFKNNILLEDAKSHNDLKDVLINSHFFIFPSKEPNEGHSNSLNEAMAYGVVPIVSNNNYLSSIVGNENLVIKTYNAIDYSNKITEIINTKCFNQISQFVYNRVKEKFTQKVVEEEMINSINKIFNKK